MGDFLSLLQLVRTPREFGIGRVQPYCDESHVLVPVRLPLSAPCRYDRAFGVTISLLIRHDSSFNQTWLS